MNGSTVHHESDSKRGKLYNNMWVIFFVGLIARLIHIAFLKEGFYFSDFKAYEAASLCLLDGEGFGPDYDRPPIYPLFLVATHLIFGVHIFPVRIVQALLGAFSCILISQITGQIFNRKAAVVAAWISALYPYYIFITGLLYPTQITAFLLICTIYFLLLSLKKRVYLNLVIASICLGAASLAVPACIAFVPFLVLWYLFISKVKLRQALTYSLLNIIVVGVCLLPWTYICYQRYGHLVLIDPRVGNHLPVLKTEEAENDGRWVDTNDRVKMILANPGKFIGNITKEFINFWNFVPDRVVTRHRDYREQVHSEDQRMVVNNPYTSSLMNWVSIFSYGPVFILSIVGIILCFSDWRLLSLPLLLILSHAVAYSFFFTQTRYRLPVEFCLMILAGGGAIALWNKIQSKKQVVP
jgi:4-amino-4-deoxy-L-arabinose transferase-like glycosyltransferase